MTQVLCDARDRGIFSFQAEDGIRDYKVTGVQTCALPIFWRVEPPDASGTSDATIVTNAHVVRATSEKALTLQLADQRQLQGTLSAVDPAHDLAALRVHAGGLQPAQIGNAAALRVGALVLAVGHPL